MILALDTELTGLDWWHGSRAFYVTTCTDDGTQYNFRWRVDPYTRKIVPDKDDLEHIQSLIEEADIIVGQNIKTEAHALHFARKDAGLKPVPFPWHKVRDTLIGGHILASNLPHNLTAMVLQYLGDDIEPFENDLARSVQECRRMCGLKAFKEEHGLIAVAKEGRPDMPSAGEKCWRLDYWLPFELAHILKLPDNHVWRTDLENYANQDSIYTLALWREMEPLIRKNGDWNRFMENMEIARITFEMEQYGITRSRSRSAAMQDKFRKEESSHSGRCVELAKKFGFDLKMPNGAGVNDSLREFMFDVMQLPVIEWTDGGKSGVPRPALNKDSMAEWILTQEGDTGKFVKTLSTKRSYSSAVKYLDSYDLYAIQDKPGSDVERLHPSINPVGTSTTRTSSNNPNSQNAGKGKDLEDGEKLASVREEFGPAEGREWYPIDYENIEMMIPAYYSGEESMIELFERPNDPPYFGSYHLLNASIIYPDLFWPLADQKGAFKDKYKATWYKHLKNFGFAVQYDAGERTADATAKRKGAFERVVTKLHKLTAAKQATLAYAKRHGIVRTLPDLSVPGDKGYPLMVGRYENGQIKATTPWNYKIQGTAGWAKKKAMIRVDQYLKECWKREKFTGRMVLDIHDEIVLDFPKGRPGNREKIIEIKRLMEMSGKDIGIPLRVSVAYCPVDWGHEEKF